MIIVVKDLRRGREYFCRCGKKVYPLRVRHITKKRASSTGTGYYYCGGCDTIYRVDQVLRVVDAKTLKTVRYMQPDGKITIRRGR